MTKLTARRAAKYRITRLNPLLTMCRLLGWRCHALFVDAETGVLALQESHELDDVLDGDHAPEEEGEAESHHRRHHFRLYAGRGGNEGPLDEEGYTQEEADPGRELPPLHPPVSPAENALPVRHDSLVHPLLPHEYTRQSGFRFVSKSEREKRLQKP